MARTVGSVEADDRRAGEREVADRVESLVADELVRIAQTFGIEDLIAVDRDGIVERGTQRKTRLPQLLDVANESEGARAGDFPAEGRGIDIERAALTADGRRLEVDLDIEPEPAIGRQKLGVAAFAFDAHRLQDPEAASQPRLLHDPRLVDRADEIGGGAVHDGRFGSVDLDEDVVDLKAGERGQKVLDRTDAGPRRIAEHRAEGGVGHVRAFGFEQPLAAARQAGAKEDDARIDVRGMKGELGRPRRVDSNAGHLDPVAERLLKAYFHLQLSPDVRPAPIETSEARHQEPAPNAKRRHRPRSAHRDGLARRTVVAPDIRGRIRAETNHL